MNKSKASGVSWVKPAEPSFLKKFKSDVGFKEGPDVDTKRQLMPSLDDDSGSDREDELPQVVVLKDGDLSQEEVKKMKGEHSQEEVKKMKGGDAPADGKILFKKPAKRSSSDRFQGITASSSKKKRSEGGEKKKKEEEEEEEQQQQQQQQQEEVKPRKKVKNTSLLSFGGDEEEEED